MNCCLQVPFTFEDSHNEHSEVLAGREVLGSGLWVVRSAYLVFWQAGVLHDIEVVRLKDFRNAKFHIFFIWKSVPFPLPVRFNIGSDTLLTMTLVGLVEAAWQKFDLAFLALQHGCSIPRLSVSRMAKKRSTERILVFAADSGLTIP